MTDAAFLAQVIAHPDDDGPRLVFADRLDERGECARAEFIRVQCALATWSHNDHCLPDSHCVHCPDPPRHETLRRRERELLTQYRYFRLTLSPELFDATGLVAEPGWFRRGLVGSVTLTAAEFFGDPCGRCERGRARIPHGFGGVQYVNCPACRGTGRVEGLAAALFRAAPVTEVRLSDREPLRISDGWVLSRGSGGPEMTRHVIPPEVFDLIPTVRGGLGGLDERPEAGWIRTSNVVTGAPEELLFLTPDRTLSALSAACVAVGRDRAELPALARLAAPVPRGVSS